MIRRLYLPFRSARAYKDRGMAKWMGFFISDHLSALQEEAMTVEFGDETSAEEILEWLSQIYIQQLTMTYYIKKKKSCSIMTGKILELTQEYMILHLTNSAEATTSSNFDSDSDYDSATSTPSVDSVTVNSKSYKVSHSEEFSDPAYERVSLHSIIRLSKPASSADDFNEPQL